MPHGHSHCHDGHDDHDHGPTADEIGFQYNLFEKIDKDNLQCLNEAIDGSGKTVFKPWDQRLDRVHVRILHMDPYPICSICLSCELTLITLKTYFSSLKVMLMKSCCLIYRSRAT